MMTASEKRAAIGALEELRVNLPGVRVVRSDADRAVMVAMEAVDRIIVAAIERIRRS